MEYKVLVITSIPGGSQAVRAAKALLQDNLLILDTDTPSADHIAGINPDVLIYDCLRSLSSWLAKTNDLRKRHRLCTVVVAHSYDLKEEILAYRSDCDAYLLQSTPDALFLARLEGLARRTLAQKNVFSLPVPTQQLPPIRYGNTYLSPSTGDVSVEDKPLHLTEREFRLAMAFIAHQEEVLTREWLRSHVWDNKKISPRSIDAQITKLKRKLPDFEMNLEALYRRGYRLRRHLAKVA